MAIFPCTYYTFATKYPNTGVRVTLGRSYQYDMMPLAPDQRIFLLKLQGMQYFVDQNGDIDTIYAPERNMAVLEAFYNTHKTATEFTLNHPLYGAVQCKFNTPLDIPDGLLGGGGVLPPFDIELIEIP